MKSEGYGGGVNVSRNGIAGIDNQVLNGRLATDERQDTRMIDQTQRLNAVVKDELARLAPLHGVSKNDIGYGLTQSFGPMAGPTGQVGLFLCWVVTVTLRLVLLGYDPVAFPVLVPGAIAGDAAFRDAVKQALEKAIEMRDEAMSQVPPAGV
jgi:hypothetical protein